MVFGVAEGLAGCHHDRVPGVNPERIEVLSNTAQQSGHAGGGGGQACFMLISIHLFC